jgi:hypothetical protein
VIDAAGVTEPMTLLGISQGGAACIEYAIKYPERVSKLILYGAYARGARHRGNPDREREHTALIDLMRAGWDRQNPVFRQLFTSRFIPEGTDEQVRWFNELCLKTTSPQAAADLMAVRSGLNIVDTLGAIRVPTLVLHAKRDNAVPFAEGQLLASNIPGAEFVELDSCNRPRLHGRESRRWGRSGVCRTLAARARHSRGDERRLEQRGDSGAARHQRKNRAQSHVESLRQTRRLDARPGHRLRA